MEKPSRPVTLADVDAFLVQHFIPTLPDEPVEWVGSSDFGDASKLFEPYPAVTTTQDTRVV